jgi:hypothetical protein
MITNYRFTSKKLISSQNSLNFAYVVFKIREDGMGRSGNTRLRVKRWVGHEYINWSLFWFSRIESDEDIKQINEKE